MTTEEIYEALQQTKYEAECNPLAICKTADTSPQLLQRLTLEPTAKTKTS